MSQCTTQGRTELARFTNDWYDPGAGVVKRALWHLVSWWFFAGRCPGSSARVSLLRLFGAKVGRRVVIKPAVNIKYPWRLRLGDHVWIGEGAWIDNLADVRMGDNVCVSQGAMLLTGNHNYKSERFDLIIGEITLEDGVWIGAQAVVCPGVRCGSHAVLSVGSVATKDLDPYSIYQGNPAVKVRERIVVQD